MRAQPPPSGDRPNMPPCPACGSCATLPILWGMPGPEAMELSVTGEIVLGGCIVDVESGPPNIECSACGTRWQVGGDDDRLES